MLVWHGNPFDVAANRRLVAVRQGNFAKQVQRSSYKKAAASMVQAFEVAWGGREPIDGPVVLQVVTYWPRKHAIGPAIGLAMGDADAVTKSVQDALEAAGVLHDDAQVVTTVATKARGTKESARIEVRVSTVEGVSG